MRVSEICVNQIRVNQGLGVLVFGRIGCDSSITKILNFAKVSYFLRWCSQISIDKINTLRYEFSR